VFGQPGSPRRRNWNLAATIVVLLVVIYLAVKPLPDWLANTHGLDVPDARAEVARYRTALLASLAGLIAAGGALLGGLTYRLNNRVAVQTHERDLQAQITERFTRAIDHLGSDTLDIRLGGIYALERIASDSADDHPQVVEVLTAFVREHAPLPSAMQNWPLAVRSERRRRHRRPLHSWPFDSPLTDIQAALTVLGRRNSSQDREGARLDLSSTDLSGAVLAGADLTGAVLSRANLAEANLAEAKLEGANLDRSNFRTADLSMANLAGASLVYVDFTMAGLAAANLSDARGFKTCFHNARLAEANATRANLKNANFAGAGLRKTVFNKARLVYANFEGADMTDADLSNAVLEGATVSEFTTQPEPGFDWKSRGGKLTRTPLPPLRAVLDEKLAVARMTFGSKIRRIYEKLEPVDPPA
jgi:uncharacterized protein YjbI with pentapeptide repeats